MFVDCDCDVKGTVSEICDKNNGRCLCKPGYGGARCDQCISGFTGFPNCLPCNCSSIGSPSESCDVTGKCVCHPHFGGKQCNQCSPGFYQYPNCTGRPIYFSIKQFTSIKILGHLLKFFLYSL